MTSRVLLGWILFLGGCSSEPIVNDVSRLNPTSVSEILAPKSEAEIIEAVKSAAARGLGISIGGARHSQGGQTSYAGSVHLDMRSFNKVLEVDVRNKLLRVQAGATWEQVQDAISPLGLSVQVQQASNIFTVGGSLSVNIHGWDPRFRQFIETVESFRMIDASARKLEVSRTQNPELFRWVIGGYGMLGVITDVSLHLTENHLLEKTVREMTLDDYPAFFEASIRSNPKVELHYARPSINPQSLFESLLVATYSEKAPEALIEPHLPDEKNTFRNFWAFQISRYFRIPGLFDFGKPLRWWIQKEFVDVPGSVKEISRNRAMRPEIQFALIPPGFFHTDILQEYFVPKGELLKFMSGLKQILSSHDTNLLSVTIRPIHKDSETGLPYAKFDGFAVVLYINLLTFPQKFFSERWGVERAKLWTKEIVDLVESLGGTFYLPYQRYISRDQLHRIYPEFAELTKMKSKYDPTNLFRSQFYETYK